MPFETILVIAGIVWVFAVYMTLLVYGEVIAGGPPPETAAESAHETEAEAGAEARRGTPAAAASVAAAAPAPRVTQETHARWPETAALAVPAPTPAAAQAEGRTGARAEEPKSPAVTQIG